MAESNTQDTFRLTDWLILAFVVVVMGLLITDLGSNVIDILNRGRESVPAGTLSGRVESGSSAVLNPNGKPMGVVTRQKGARKVPGTDLRI